KIAFNNMDMPKDVKLACGLGGGDSKVAKEFVKQFKKAKGGIIDEISESVDSSQQLSRMNPDSFYTHKELLKLIEEAQLSGKNKGLQSHHLLEKQFAKLFDIADRNDIIAVPLTSLWHKGVNQVKVIGVGKNIDNLITKELSEITGASYRKAVSVATREQAWQAHRNVYEKIGQSDWARAIYEAYIKQFKIPY
ncbi:hypothetical protein, partial [Clostridium estertheticum]|uniref:hypothetical protein n=1 Tax=Clostridium estertheticum TaxID=238834 RepID=UPI001CF1F2AE